MRKADAVHRAIEEAAARFALIYWGPLVLFFAALIIARASGKGPEPFGAGIGAVIIVLPHVYGSVLDWFRSRARVLFDEIDGRLHVTVPLLGQITFELNHFQGAEMGAPDIPPWVSQALLFLAIGFLVVLEVSHFLRGTPVEPENILIAGMGLASASICFCPSGRPQPPRQPRVVSRVTPRTRRMEKAGWAGSTSHARSPNAKPAIALRAKTDGNKPK